VIRSFRSQETERLFHRQPSRKFRAIERSALRKLDMLDAAPNVANALRVLRALPGNRLERLRGDREGQYSIRINDPWRVCFEWRDGAAHRVEITDYR
jgi:proteic killer suppression protein